MNYAIYIDGFIGQSDFFSDGFSLKSLREKVAAAPTGTNELTIHINSGGGSVTEGFAIYDFLTNSDFKVNTSVDGLCGSIATVIAQATNKGGKRLMQKNSEYFVHNPYWTPDGPNPMEAADMAALSDQLKSCEEKVAQLYASTTGQPIDTIKEKMAAQTSFTATEAKELGFVDEIIGEVSAFQKHLISASGKEYKIAAFIDSTQKPTMDIIKRLNEFEAKLTSLLKPKITNAMAKTSEGVEIFYDGELKEGTKVFTDEAMTSPAPDGVHTVGDTKYTIKDGSIVSVEGAPAAADDALKAEVEALKATLAQKEAELQNSISENTTIKAELEASKQAVETVQTEFVAFKGQFVTGDGELKPEFQGFKGDGTQKPSALQKASEKLAAKLG